MANFFNLMNAKYFDYANVFKPITESLITNAEALAKANNQEIEWIRSPRKPGRKDEHIDKILEMCGRHEGLVNIWAQMETIQTYRAWTDKKTGKTSFVNGTINSKAYYFYFIDRDSNSSPVLCTGEQGSGSVAYGEAR